MTNQVINIGTAPNNGTGDPLRTAFAKAANNFAEIYASLSFNDSTLDLTIANNLIVTSNTTANVLNANSKLNVGTASGFAFGTLAIEEIHNNQNTYVQTVLQNANSGLNASGDFVITSDTGNDAVNYIDLGLNSSNYSNAALNITGAGDGYLYTSNGQLAIGTAAANALLFHTGGTISSNERVRITPTGNVGIGNTNPLHNISINGTIFANTSITLGNSSVNAVVNSTLYSGTANNASYLGGTIASSYQLTGASLTSNVNAVLASFNGTMNATSFTTGNNTTGTGGFVSNSGQIFIGNNTGNTVVTASSLTVNGYFVANSTGIFTTTPFTPGNVNISNTSGNVVIVPTSVLISNSTSNLSLTPSYIVITTNGNTGVSIGNSTVNTFSNSSHFFSGNSTQYAYGNSIAESVVSTTGTIGNTVTTATTMTVSNTVGNVQLTTTSILVQNSTGVVTHTPASVIVSANAASNIAVGNSTINVSINSTSIATGIMGIGTGGILINTTTGASSNIAIGNNTINTYINSTAIYVGTSNNKTATGANGYTTLPNGLKLAYGSLLVNSTANTITLSSNVGLTPTSNILNIAVTSNATATYFAVTTVNSTAFVVVANSTTNALCYWQALVN